MLFVILMLGGTFALGLSDIYRKKSLNAGVDDQAILTITLFGTGIFLLPFLLLMGLPVLEKGFWPAVIGTVVLNLLLQNAFIKAFKYGDASVIAPLRLIIPPLVIVTGFLFLNEQTSPQGIAGILITALGLYFLITSSNKKPSGKNFDGLAGKESTSPRQQWFHDKGILYGLVGSLLAAFSFPLDKMAIVNSSALFATFFIFTTLGLLTYIVNVLKNKNFGLLTLHSLRTHFRGNFLITFWTSLGTILTNQALNYSLASYGASLKRLQALWTVIIARKTLDEKGTGKRVLATLIMFIGILLSVLWK